MKSLLNLILIALLFTSCVSKKKYLDSLAQRDRLTTSETNLKKKLANKTAELRKSSEANTSLKKDFDTCTQNFQKSVKKNGDLKKKNTELTSSYLTDREKMDAALRVKLDELDKREKTIKKLKDALTERDDLMNSVLAKIKKALKAYNDDELTVEMIDGKVYVALSDKLLFKSGSAKLDEGGKEALKLLASVIEKNADLDIIIEGHTDNVPIKTSRFEDNWDLSVIRATSVVRVLTQEYGLDPKKINASGRGEFFPKQANDSPEGKSANRRTEIIIAPQLDEIFDFFNN